MSKATKPASAQPVADPQDLTVRSLTIADAKGRPRIRLGLDDLGHPAVVLSDHRGQERVRIHVSDSYEKAEKANEGWPHVELLDSQGRECFYLDVADTSLYLKAASQDKTLFAFERAPDTGCGLYFGQDGPA